MPDTIPDLTAYPGSVTISALDGTTDPYTGLVYISENVGPDSSPTFAEQHDRDKQRLINHLKIVAEGRFWRETIPGLDYGVFPLNYTLGGTQKHFEGATAQSLTDNATNYIYINASNALAVSTSGFPADTTTFFRVATVVALNGDVSSESDERGYNRNVVPQTTSSSDSGTNNTAFVIDEDNTGGAAAASMQVRFQRGTSNAEDAALEWKEADAGFRARSQHSTDTLCPVDMSALKIAGVSAVTSDGAAKVQSAVAGSGLGHSSGVLSVNTSSAAGTSLSGDNIAVDPSDGICLDANGVAVSLSADSGLQLSGSSGSKTLEVYPDSSTVDINGSGQVEVKDNGLTGAKLANQSTASATPGTAPIILRAQLVAGNTVSIHNANAPFKYRIIDAWSIAQSADGGTWKLDNGTNDITNAVTVTGTDKTRNMVGTIDDAYWEIAASGTLRVVGDGANADATVFVMVERVA